MAFENKTILDNTNPAITDPTQPNAADTGWLDVSRFKNGYTLEVTTTDGTVTFYQSNLPPTDIGSAPATSVAGVQLVAKSSNSIVIVTTPTTRWLRAIRTVGAAETKVNIFGAY